MNRTLAGAIVCLLLAGGAAAAEQSIVGVWYEDVTYGGSRVISVLEINPDGTYQSVHRRCLNPGEQDTADAGHWTYANGHLRLSAMGNDGWPVVDEYQTESIDGRVWVYRGVAGHGFQLYGPVKFRDLKVVPGAKLPSCDLSS